MAMLRYLILIVAACVGGCHSRSGGDAAVASLPAAPYSGQLSTGPLESEPGKPFPTRLDVERVLANLAGKPEEERVWAIAELLQRIHQPLDRAHKELCDFATERLHDYFAETHDEAVIRALDRPLDGGQFTCAIFDAPGTDDDDCDESPDGGRVMAINHEDDGGYCKLFVKYAHKECILHLAEMWVRDGQQAFGDGFAHLAYGESGNFCDQPFTCQCESRGAARDAGSLRMRDSTEPALGPRDD
jgi:hypothetical protein